MTKLIPIKDIVFEYVRISAKRILKTEKVSKSCIDYFDRIFVSLANHYEMMMEVKRKVIENKKEEDKLCGDGDL